MLRSGWTACRSTRPRRNGPGSPRPWPGPWPRCCGRRGSGRWSGSGTAGEWTVSAEKGYLKECGNLLFHFALLAVLVGVGFGSWYGWHGNRLLVQGADKGFCNTLTQFDESSLGARVARR